MSNPYGNPNQNPNQGPWNQGQGQIDPYAAQRAWAQQAQQPQHDVQAYQGVGADRVQAFVAKTFGWMAMGLGVSAVVAYFTASTGLVFQLMPFMLPLFIAQLAIVFGLSAFVQKMNAPMAIGAFLFYAALNGLTLSLILLAYTMTSIASVFAITTGMFGFMAVYGLTTKKDLTSIGSLLFMALIGLVIAMVVNMFLSSPMMSYIISCAGVVIFVGLTAWDAQKIKQMGMRGFGDDDSEQRGAIMGALTLYLDFINLFLFLLRLLGGNRN